MKKDEAAAEVFGDLVKQYPNNQYFYQKQAYFLVRSKNNADAIKIYDKIESKFGLTEELIGKKHSLYLGLGKQKKATRELQKLTNTFPSNLEYQHMLASHFQRIGETKKAKEVFQKIYCLLFLKFFS